MIIGKRSEDRMDLEVLAEIRRSPQSRVRRHCQEEGRRSKEGGALGAEQK